MDFFDSPGFAPTFEWTIAALTSVILAGTLVVIAEICGAIVSPEMDVTLFDPRDERWLKTT